MPTLYSFQYPVGVFKFYPSRINILKRSVLELRSPTFNSLLLQAFITGTSGIGLPYLLTNGSSILIDSLRESGFISDFIYI